MTVIPFTAPIVKPRHLPAAELRQQYRQNSRIEVLVGGGMMHHTDGSMAPDLLHIEFHGEIAKIPSLKNWPIVTKSGGHIMNPETTARLMVMTELWEKATAGKRLCYMKDELFCIVILGKRGRVFDEDNGFAAVKDWLEPRVKAKRDRRWGIGLVDNDCQVSGLALHSWKTGVEVMHTTIIIQPLGLVREPLLTFLARAQI
jgi:hypothetical protein